MINKSDEVAAIIHTKSVAIFMREMGDDPIRAAGALLLELPGIEKRLDGSKDNIVVLSFQHRKPGARWDYLKAIGQRQGVSAGDLWTQDRPKPEELQELIHDYPPRLHSGARR